jgi:hypothetical protein
MNCTKTVKEYSEAAGRKVEFCRELDGAADGTLGGFGLAGMKGVMMDGSKLKWWTGLPIGAGAHYLSRALVNYYNTIPTTTPILVDEYMKGLPGLLIGGVMVIFKSTRMAGLTAIGTGVALTAANAIMGSTTTTTTTVKGLPVAEMGRAGGIRVLTGASGGLGLPVAEELSRAPVQVLTGSGAFGATIGTNFARR